MRAVDSYILLHHDVVLCSPTPFTALWLLDGRSMHCAVRLCPLSHVPSSPLSPMHRERGVQDVILSFVRSRHTYAMFPTFLQSHRHGSPGARQEACDEQGKLPRTRQSKDSHSLCRKHSVNPAGVFTSSRMTIHCKGRFKHDSHIFASLVFTQCSTMWSLGIEISVDLQRRLYKPNKWFIYLAIYAGAAV